MNDRDKTTSYELDLVRKGHIPVLSLRTPHFFEWFEHLQKVSCGNALCAALWVDTFIAGLSPQEAWAEGKTLLNILDGHNMRQTNTVFPVWYIMALALAGEDSRSLSPISAWQGYSSDMTPPVFIHSRHDSLVITLNS